jgi:hypothetical protein
MNIIIKRTFCLLLIFCSGCVFISAPKDDVGFSKVRGIHSLEGCYQNQGEGKNNSPSRYLSSVIWPESKLNHSDIKLIRVVAINDKTLKVTAESLGTIVLESLFVEGKDFNVNSKKIRAKGEPMISLAYPAGNVFIGVAYASQALGIDERGDAKLQETGTFAGTVFIVIPFAGHTQDSFRFRRVDELCKERQRSEN